MTGCADVLKAKIGCTTTTQVLASKHHKGDTAESDGINALPEYRFRISNTSSAMMHIAPNQLCPGNMPYRVKNYVNILYDGHILGCFKATETLGILTAIIIHNDHMILLITPNCNAIGKFSGNGTTRVDRNRLNAEEHLSRNQKARTLVLHWGVVCEHTEICQYAVHNEKVLNTIASHMSLI